MSKQQQPSDHQGPGAWAADMARMQWRAASHSAKQVGGLLPQTLGRAFELVKNRQIPTPKDYLEYSLDAGQRWLIMLDILRKRGNQYFAHEEAGLPTVLSFDYRTLIDARTLERPANYALLEIIPPANLAVDPAKRPFVIVDPRAGHGPGIGGFKEDSEVGEALRAGHPVYMVSFYPDPVPGQTLGDVGAAEALFLQEVARRHPNAGKPVVIGNCQGGWAVMALAAAVPGLTGPIVINGAPLSYWAGASGKNPMRYNGGLFGGSWMCQLGCDLGHGTFDGASLVSNFENLDLANTYWKKLANLLANVDSEEERYLEFERWWNGHYTLTQQEMRAIVEELFIGNRLASGELRDAMGATLDLRNIKAPVVVFASEGDNITPPEQAFNWIADTYGDTREIIANGQVIVYLKHSSVGHLGIFVSGAVAVKEHRQIVSLLEHIEQLVPGLYEMTLKSVGTPDKPAYEIVLENREISDIVAADRDSRADEREFEVVENISEINSRIYDAFMSPLVKAIISERTAKLIRNSQPARLKHYVLSDKNPALRAISGAADYARANRQPADQDNPMFAWRELMSNGIASWLDCVRDARDATAENMFYATYGFMRALGLGGAYEHPGGRAPQSDSEDQVEKLLERIDQGGLVEAVARALIIAQRAQGFSLPARAARTGERLRQLPEFAKLTQADLHKLLQEQTTLVAFAPERAAETLGALLPTLGHRKRAAEIIRSLLEGEQVDERFVAAMQHLAQLLDLPTAAKPAAGAKSGPTRLRSSGPQGS